MKWPSVLIGGVTKTKYIFITSETGKCAQYKRVTDKPLGATVFITEQDIKDKLWIPEPQDTT